MYSAKTISAVPQAHAANCNCSICSGVNCFERPRFFPGQPLTDKDLEAAQRYVIEKNKLHNRYLVGTGVVCGLMVTCDPCCDGSVSISSGYAIDCEGNDIVLCENACFDILGYLKKHKKQEDLPYCGHANYRPQIQQQAEDSQEYLLVLSYAEEMTKPITAMVRDNGCNNSRCEPSRIKETFHIDLVKTRTDKPDFSKIKITDLIPDQSFLGQLRDCMKTYQEANKLLRSSSTGFSDPAALNTLFKALRSLVMEIYKKEPIIRCDLPEKIAEIERGFQSTEILSQKQKYVTSMLAILIQFFIDCFCNSLLVKCPECKEGEGVVLACVTIKGNKITKICNIVRKQLITGPSLQYWTQPLFSSIETLLDFICCDFDLLGLLNRQRG